MTERVLTERAAGANREELSQANARLREINADLQRLKESYRDLYHHAPVLYFSLDAPRPARRLQRDDGAARSATRARNCSAGRTRSC